jgi:hypothetical protein
MSLEKTLLTIFMASVPETRMIPIAPPGAVAMAAIVDMEIRCKM